MTNVKIKCPAKINLTLEIVGKRDDGFHNIKSIMQMISLYDYLTIKTTSTDKNTTIKLSGNSEEIPYNEKNLVYKAVKLYFERAGIENQNLEIYIEKNIPVAAGLAGGSTDAAGTLYGLNCIYNNFSLKELEKLCALLGSDLNVCLEGGCNLATSRGEVTQKLKGIQSNVTLIKPKHLGISAKEAYTKYSLKENKPKNNMTEKMLIALLDNKDIKTLLYNDLEYAIFNDYPELQKIKTIVPSSIMSGSGSTYFVLENINPKELQEDYQIITGLNFIEEGVKMVNGEL